MKYPHHIILDLKTKSLSYDNQSWALSYATKTQQSSASYDFFMNTQLTKATPNVNMSPVIKQNYSTVSTDGLVHLTTTARTYVNNPLWDVFTIDFVRREFMYTKLKYSRCPESDIVSGGVAAIFSGFLGFLICEKFGLELLDSGDFYTFLMYVVFLTFALRPFLFMLSSDKNIWHCFSYKPLFTFVKDLLILGSRSVARLILSLLGSKYSQNLPVYDVLFSVQFVSNVYHFWRRVIIFLKNTPKKGYETFSQVK